MKQKLAPLFLIILVFCPAASQDFSDLYGGVVSGFESWIDPNAGSTGFLSLLIPSGGLAEGMGRAYTAVAKDSSFFDYNPAASSVLENTEAGFSHNNWILDTQIENVVFTTRWRDLGIGFSGKFLYASFSEYDDWAERVAKGYYSESTGIANVSYNFLSGYYFSGISLGANFKAMYRSIPDYTDSDGLKIAGSGASQSTFAFAGDIGLLTKINLLKFYSSRTKNFSIGVAMRNVGFSLLSDDALPTSIAAGIAYNPFRPITVSFDINQPINLVNPAQTEDFSLAAGVLVGITDDIAMQTGFLLKGANPRFSLGSTIAVEAVTFIINYTLDLTTQAVIMNRISLEAKINLGDRGRAKLLKMVEDLYLSGIEEYANGNGEKAVELWKQVLDLNPGFDPARESLKAAEGAILLRKRMEDIQKLEQ